MKKIKALLLAMLILLMPMSLVTADQVSADVNRVSKIGTSASIAKAYYYFKPKCASTKVLAIRSLSSTTNAPAVIRKRSNSLSCQNRINAGTSGTYVLTNRKSGKVLGSKNNSIKSGATVCQTVWQSLNAQRWYIIQKGSYFIIQSAISKNVLTVQNNGTADNTPVILKPYTGASGQLWKLTKAADNIDTNTNRIYKSTQNGKKTLTALLKNAMVPVGRTLYIWGGGWGGVGSDSSIIGYQSSWLSFFNKHATSSYDYTQYRYQYGNGLDCSGFVAWTVYNTLNTKAKQSSIVTSSTLVASTYEKWGWCDIVDSSDKTYRPGDIISMNGHVWISLGQYSDGSILLVHSSPKGVQISGTSGTAAAKAAYYMKKYFPAWPYDARTVGSAYTSNVVRGRWKFSGTKSVLKDPDGLQKMSADQVMKFLFGS